MNKAVNKYPKSDILLSFDFSHCADGKQKKVLLCDWTIEYEIVEHQHRMPTKQEGVNIRRQEEVLGKADHIITLFPNVHDFLKEKYASARYLGNGLNCERYDDSHIEELHFKSNRILFIGRPRYKKALTTLINAVGKYNSSSQEKLVIDAIGIPEQDVTGTCVHCYGFLNKGIKEDSAKYESLMKGALAFVNVNDDWIGAQSLMEAMYYKLPVIINPNRDIYKVYGETIDFGWYCPNDEDALCECLMKLRNLNREEYITMANNAYDKVEDQTWSAFAEKLLQTAI